MPDPIQTMTGPLRTTRATPSGADQVLTVVRGQAAWLASRGSGQWSFYATPAGEAYIRRRIDEHEVYLFHDSTGDPVATLCLQWADAEFWGAADGNDGSAGYIHQLAVGRKIGGRGVGAVLLDWAGGRIAVAGRGRFRLDCLIGNPALVRYYSGLGFSPVRQAAVRGLDVQLWQRSVPV